MSYLILRAVCAVLLILYFMSILQYRSKRKEYEFLCSLLREQDTIKTHFKDSASGGIKPGDAFKGYSDGKVND